MLTIVPKWKIIIGFPLRPNVPPKQVVLFMSDHHVSNIMTALAKMDFSDNPLESPSRITFELQDGLGQNSSPSN